MTNVFQFALLGLGIGAIYALLAQGVVVIYRGAGIVNFAQGAVAMVGAYTFYELHVNHGQSFAAAAVVAVVACTVLGVAIHQLVMRPLARASSLVRLVANLGVLIVLQSAATIRYAGQTLTVPSSLPTHLVHIGSAVITSDRLMLAGIAIVLTAGLWALNRFTIIGAATSAVQENALGAATLGWSPNVIAAFNWALGCALAGLAGVLVVPITGLQVTNLTLIVVAALAAALLGSFASFWLTLAGGLGMGILNSEVSFYVHQTGWPDAVPFLVILGILVFRGRSLPLRDQILERLPRAGTGVIRPVWLLVSAAVLVFLVEATLPVQYVIAVSVLMTAALFLLSVVVLTGYAGQLSLAQYALGGCSALIAGQLIAIGHWPQWAAIIVGLIATVPIGVLFALPALRTRGVNLAVLTLGLGLTIYLVVFSNTSYTGGTSGVTVGPLHLFGIDFDPFLRPKNFTLLTIGCFIVAALGVANVRRSRVGRRLLAVRSNERAAASLGISVVGAKLYAFGLSAFLAGAAGILLAFSNYIVVYTAYDPLSSINVVALAVIGGVGYLAGPVAGSVLAMGSVGTVIGNSLFGQGFANWLTLIGGVLLIITLMLQPDGTAAGIADQLHWLTRRRRRKTAPATPRELAPMHKVRPASLEVRGLRVVFGTVRAVDDVSLSVKPGEVVGLIGPNGAGKTTFIDAVSGFVPTVSGSILLGGADVSRWSPHRRVRAGLSRSFQSLELFEDLTIRENLRTAYESRDWRGYLTAPFFAGSDPAPRAASAAVDIFELAGDLDRLPGELSAGRRRLVAIARAIAAEPSVLLLDEPAAGLDENESVELARLIRALADGWGIAVLLVEHDVNLIMTTCDRVNVIDFGKPLAQGTPDEVRSDPLVVAAYLGVEAAASG